MNTEAHFVGGWKPVAYLLMDGDPGETYKSKLNLEQGINKVFLLPRDLLILRGGRRPNHLAGSTLITSGGPRLNPQ
jgi:hypothetical protein